MSKWKKLLFKELDEKTPPLRADICDMPITSSEISVSGGALIKRKKLYYGIFAGAAVLLAALILVLTLFPFKRAVFVYTVEINPAVTFSADANGKVTGAVASNKDADAVLAGDFDKELIGKKFSEVAVLYADRAAKLGFLDLNTAGGAVRLSAFGDGGKGFSAATAALENYFMEKGAYVAVFGESVGEADFSKRSGFKAESAKAAAAYVGGETLFAARAADGVADEDAAQIYESEVLSDTVLLSVRDGVNDKLWLIEENANDLNEIASLNLEIFYHPENPAVILKDYWNVLRVYGTDTDGEFGALMKKMEAALSEYEKNYGEAITDALRLKEAANVYVSLSVATLRQILEDFSSAAFKEFHSFISDIMSLVGAGGEAVTDLLRLPETVAEYKSKAAEAAVAEANYRIKKFSDSYNAARAPLGKAEYGGYVQDLTEKYGSLSAYWDAAKN